jgi:hypothetical protein
VHIGQAGARQWRARLGSARRGIGRYDGKAGDAAAAIGFPDIVDASEGERLGRLDSVCPRLQDSCFNPGSVAILQHKLDLCAGWPNPEID